MVRRLIKVVCGAPPLFAHTSPCAIYNCCVVELLSLRAETLLTSAACVRSGYDEGRRGGALEIPTRTHSRTLTPLAVMRVMMHGWRWWWGWSVMIMMTVIIMMVMMMITMWWWRWCDVIITFFFMNLLARRQVSVWKGTREIVDKDIRLQEMRAGEEENERVILRKHKRKWTPKPYKSETHINIYTHVRACACVTEIHLSLCACVCVRVCCTWFCRYITACHREHQRLAWAQSLFKAYNSIT